MSRNIDIIFIIIVLFIYIIKTLVTYQVTNDHGLICLHKLNTSIVQTRLVSVRTTQKWLHISTCTPLTQRLQPHPVGWTKTRLTTSYCLLYYLKASTYNMHCIDLLALYSNYTQYYLQIRQTC